MAKSARRRLRRSGNEWFRRGDWKVGSWLAPIGAGIPLGTTATRVLASITPAASLTFGELRLGRMELSVHTFVTNGVTNYFAIGLYVAQYDRATGTWGTQTPGLVDDVNQDWIFLEGHVQAGAGALSTPLTREFRYNRNLNLTLNTGQALVLAITNTSDSTGALLFTVAERHIAREIR